MKLINLVVLPIIVPLFIGTLLLLFRKNLVIQRLGGIVGAFATFAIALFLLQTVHSDGIQVVTLGSWAAPYGISLVSDLLSALLVAAASLLTGIILWYSMYALGEKENYHSFTPPLYLC